MSETQPEQKPIPSSVKMAGGSLETVALKSGATAAVKVQFLPSRHLDRYLELRDEGLEALLLEFTVQRNVAPEGASPIWKSPDPKNAEEIAAHAAFIDSLEDEEHLKLVGIADWLNFTRAILQAERKIASGQALLPLRKRQAETLLKPVEMALRSLTSSLVIAPPSAAPATKP